MIVDPRVERRIEPRRSTKTNLTLACAAALSLLRSLTSYLLTPMPSISTFLSVEMTLTVILPVFAVL